ncbi:THUMP domain-containing class I SAM-dependent RNA methyltransferase [Robiginitalea sp. IMCC44478]|uniref:THUMP domain-containing class I SAM-dependent RNA methyltransferase n=1 Tax=Robiginitalea sp. IMCC44478 TaxID=3459122 RepID=UPI004042E405
MSGNFEMVAKTLYGLEPVLAKELLRLGAGNVKEGVRCVFFEGDKGFMYKANLCLRTALRILKPVRTFKVKGPEDLYREIQQIDWSQFMDASNTFVVDTVLNSEHFSHSLFVSQKVKDAIVDQFRKKHGSRPGVSVTDPDLRLHLHLQGTVAHLSLDSSGSSLHLRGYRKETNIAPLNEVLAAGVLLLSGWNGHSDLLDPMCGSGTLLIEGAMIACNIPANINRPSFGFERWKDFDTELYQIIRSAALDKTREFHFSIRGYDKAPSAVRKARENIENANLAEFIRVDQKNFFETEKETKGPLLLVTNPPYGERLPVSLENFYKQIGDCLKQHYKNTRAWLLLGNLEALKKVGLRASRKIKLFNGGIESRLALFEVYEGSKKAKYQ